MGAVRAAVVWLALLHGARALPAQQPLTLDDLGHLHTLRSPTLSPGGREVVLIVSRPDFAENRHIADLVLVDVASRISRPILRDLAGVRDPRWLNDTLLAFAARGEPGGTSQLFLVGRRGAAPRQITRVPGGVRNFAFAPDGATIAFTADDLRPVREGEERFNDSFEVGNDDFLTMAPPQPVHLWLQPVAGGSPRRLTSGSWSLATPLSASGVEWTPDGQAIVVQQFATPHSGDTDKSRVAVVRLNGTVHHPAAADGRQSAPAISPDGRWIAFSAPRDGDPANSREAMLVSAGGGAVRNVSRTLDRAVSARWLPNGELLLTGTDGTRMAMWRLPVDGPAHRMALGDVVSFSAPSVARNGAIAFVGSEPDRPEELYLLEPGATRPVPLTTVHDALRSRTVGKTTGFTWETRDALTADGVVTYPPAYDAGRRYPLVLLIHGGPTASSTEGWSTRAQLFAAKGWIVFQPNYRGSDNRGNAFQRAIADDPGPGIDADVTHGIAELVRRGGVDTTRIAVSGWSFGGYVSAWLIGHHHHWKAAVVGAGAMDLFDMYALTDLNVQLRHAITGSPYVGGREEWFRAQSPLTYASRVRTPTLILHDVRDQRVTITQSFKLYHALKDNDVPVQFIAYPVAGHSPNDPVRSRDVTRRWIAWLEQYLHPTTP